MKNLINKIDEYIYKTISEIRNKNQGKIITIEIDDVEKLLDSILNIVHKENKTPKCAYCKKNYSSHFECERCGIGMCDECYNNIVEHDGHYHNICEHAGKVECDKIVKAIGNEPEYLCEECLSDIMK